MADHSLAIGILSSAVAQTEAVIAQHDPSCSDSGCATAKEGILVSNEQLKTTIMFLQGGIVD